MKGKIENTAKAPRKEIVKLRSAKAVFQVCFKFERKLGNLGSEISAKNEINRLKAKQLQVMKLRDHFKRGSGATMDNRANEGQFGTPSPEISAFINNRAKGNNLTKAQIYEMAVAEKGENFANNVASFLTGQGYKDRNSIVKPYGR